MCRGCLLCPILQISHQRWPAQHHSAGEQQSPWPSCQSVDLPPLIWDMLETAVPACQQQSRLQKSSCDIPFWVSPPCGCGHCSQSAGKVEASGEREWFPYVVCVPQACACLSSELVKQNPPTHTNPERPPSRATDQGPCESRDIIRNHPRAGGGGLAWGSSAQDEGASPVQREPDHALWDPGGIPGGRRGCVCVLGGADGCTELRQGGSGQGDLGWGAHSNLSPSWLCDPGKLIALSMLGRPL